MRLLVLTSIFLIGGCAGLTVQEWDESCMKQHGIAAVASVQAAPARLEQCVAQRVDFLGWTFNFDDIRANTRTCGSVLWNTTGVLSCVDEMMDDVKPCMTSQQLVGTAIYRRVMEAAIHFVCHDDGDRLSVFLEGGGAICVLNNIDGIKKCLGDELTDVAQTNRTRDMNSVIFDIELCSKLNSVHQCVIQAIKCDDPKPAKYLDDLITSALEVTPCKSSAGGVANTHGRGQYNLANMVPILATTVWGLGTAGGVGLLFDALMA